MKIRIDMPTEMIKQLVEKIQQARVKRDRLLNSYRKISKDLSEASRAYEEAEKQHTQATRDLLSYIDKIEEIVDGEKGQTNWISEQDQ